METAGLIKGLLNTPPNRSHGSFFGCWITLTDHQLEVYDVFFLPTSSLAIETSILGWSKFPMLKCCGIIWRGCSPSKQKKACFGLLQSIKLQFGVQKFLGEWIYRKRVCSQVLFFGCFTQMWDLEISYCSMGLVSLPTLKSYFFFSQRVGKYSSFTEHLEVLCSRQKSVAMQAAFHQTNILAALLLQVLIMQVGSVGWDLQGKKTGEGAKCLGFSLNGLVVYSWFVFVCFLRCQFSLLLRGSSRHVLYVFQTLHDGSVCSTYYMHLYKFVKTHASYSYQTSQAKLM